MTEEKPPETSNWGPCNFVSEKIPVDGDTQLAKKENGTYQWAAKLGGSIKTLCKSTRALVRSEM